MGPAPVALQIPVRTEGTYVLSFVFWLIDISMLLGVLHGLPSISKYQCCVPEDRVAIFMEFVKRRRVEFSFFWKVNVRN